MYIYIDNIVCYIYKSGVISICHRAYIFKFRWRKHAINIT